MAASSIAAWRSLFATSKIPLRLGLAAYRRGRSYDPKRTETLKVDVSESPEEQGEMLRQFEDVVAGELSGGRRLAEHLQNVKQQEKMAAEALKLKMIKAKYFRDEPELNILTWGAKEQMRHLHKEYSDEWTIEKLLATFPVSRHALNRILTSQQIAKDLVEVEKHDRRVRRRWQAMLVAEGPNGIKDERLRRTLASLVDSGRVCHIVNAGGAKDYPMPVVKYLNDMDQQKPSPRGAFSLMFERCTQRTSSSLPTPSEDRSLTSAARMLDGGRKSPNVTSSTASLQVKMPTASVVPSASRPVSRRGSSEVNPASLSNVSDAAIRAREEDSEILTRIQHLYEPRFRESEELSRTDELTIAKRVSATTPDMSDELATVELYTYDPVKGYQTPFGKVSGTPERIKVPQSVKHSNRKSDSSMLIRKGKDFYAADGEHLYSIP